MCVCVCESVCVCVCVCVRSNFQTDHKFRRPILSVLGGLFLSYLTQVPHMESSVCATGGQDRFVMGRPLDLVYGRDVPIRITLNI